MSWLPLCLLVVTCGSGIAASVAMLLQHWEFFQTVRSRLGGYATRRLWHTPPVSLIAPVKGGDVGLRENLAALFLLDYPDYELVFVVESRDDPAVPVIERLLAAGGPVPARLVVAGRAGAVGQKVHNLLRAIATLPERTRMLAFVDADARPAAGWLRNLVDRHRLDTVGATTGYRWMVPARPTLPNLIVASANAGVAALLGRHAFNVIWGGSWAISRERFESDQIARAWSRALTEDVVATRVLQQGGRRVSFEPGCLCVSPIELNWGESWDFMRRQFLLVRVYAPRLWWGGLLVHSLMQLTFWGAATAGLGLMATGSPLAWLPAGTLLSLYLLGVARALLRQEAARRALPAADRLIVARWFDLLAAPLSSLVAWAAMVASGFGNSATWRSIRYELGPRGEVIAVRRMGDEPAGTAGSPGSPLPRPATVCLESGDGAPEATHALRSPRDRRAA